MGKTAGKNKRKQIEYNGVMFDSTEEVEFCKWIEACVEYGLIEPEWEYQPITYDLFTGATCAVEKELKTKIKKLNKHLYHPHTYDPDFKLTFTQRMFDIINSNETPCSFAGFKFIRAGSPVIVDVKGGFNKQKRSFSIDQKWTYEMYGVIVHEIVPKKLFKATFLPDSIDRLTTVRRDPKAGYYDLPHPLDFING
jgi:hypothetical protein